MSASIAIKGMASQSDARSVVHRRVLARFAHVTPQYVIDRLHVWLDERLNPGAPWLTSASIAILASALRHTDVGLEWGSGRSTLWFAERTRYLVSVEHSADWFARVKRELNRRRLTNVDYRLVPAREDESAGGRAQSCPYVSAVADLATNSLDYVLVDGIHRGRCAHAAVDLLRSGGMLIVDNANRYLPHLSRSPESLRGAPDPTWSTFAERVAAWRLVWTTNGVTDTALWIKTE
jgi:SAM-dependent methyltransferase